MLPGDATPAAPMLTASAEYKRLWGLYRRLKR